MTETEEALCEFARNAKTSENEFQPAIIFWKNNQAVAALASRNSFQDAITIAGLGMFRYKPDAVTIIIEAVTGTGATMEEVEAMQEQIDDLLKAGDPSVDQCMVFHTMNKDREFKASCLCYRTVMDGIVWGDYRELHEEATVHVDNPMAVSMQRLFTVTDDLPNDMRGLMKRAVGKRFANYLERSGIGHILMETETDE